MHFKLYILTNMFPGEVSMQKVKVQRYISGKRPDYAPVASSDDDSESEDFMDQQRPERRQQMLPQVIKESNDRKMEVDFENNVSLHTYVCTIYMQMIIDKFKKNRLYF